MADTGPEPRVMLIPPPGYVLLIGPRKILVGLDGDILISRILRWTRLHFRRRRAP